MWSRKNKNILFIESGSLFGYSGFTQQFLMEAKAIKKNDLGIKIVAFESVKDIMRKRSHMYKEVLNKSEITYLIIPSWFRQNPIVRIIFDTINTAVLGLIIILGGAKIIHAHDGVSAYYAIRLKALLNLKVIYDIHGINIEEQIYGKALRENSALHNRLSKTEESLVKKADAVFCVSKQMRTYVSSKYNVSPSKFVVTPTNVDSNVFSYSEKAKKKATDRLHLDNRFVVLFMGHMQEWQVNDYFGVLFKCFKQKMENVHFMILTDRGDVFVEMFKRTGISEMDYSIYSVKHEEVPDYASAGDVGLLLRDSSIVNKVAAPAKFGEYLALGIPVIVTKGIGDTEEIVRQHKLGSVINGLNLNSISNGVDELLNLVRDEGPKLSERCNRIANDLLSVKASIESFLLTYDKFLV